jgi:hypothetical protein
MQPLRSLDTLARLSPRARRQVKRSTGRDWLRFPWDSPAGQQVAVKPDGTVERGSLSAIRPIGFHSLRAAARCVAALLNAQSSTRNDRRPIKRAAMIAVFLLKNGRPALCRLVAGKGHRDHDSPPDEPPLRVWPIRSSRRRNERVFLNRRNSTKRENVASQRRGLIASVDCR